MGKREENGMVTLGAKWKKLFWGCMAAVAVLVVLGFLLRFILFFVLGLAAGCAVAALGAARLRCPHCGKILFQEAVKLRLAGEAVCPKCGKTVTFQ